jgi:hypothetical protein
MQTVSGISGLTNIIAAHIDNDEKHRLRQTSRDFRHVRPIKPLLPRLLSKMGVAATTLDLTRAKIYINLFLGIQECRVLREICKKMSVWPVLIRLDVPHFIFLESSSMPMGVCTPVVVFDETDI